MRSELEKIATSVGLTETDVMITARHRAVIMKTVPNVVAEFYRHLFATDHDGYFRDVDVARLKSRQIEHWRHLFRAEFDDVYANHATRIGIVHRDRAITPVVYMRSYGWFTSRLVEELVGHPEVSVDARAGLAAAILKLIHLDMTIALAAYDAALVD